VIELVINDYELLMFIPYDMTRHNDFFEGLETMEQGTIQLGGEPCKIQETMTIIFKSDNYS